MNQSKNLVRIKAVYNALGPLKDKVVFVGGATVALYVDRMAEEVRPTDDVDVVVEIWSHREYAALEERLRQMGLQMTRSRESSAGTKYRGSSWTLCQQGKMYWALKIDGTRRATKILLL